jgi:hypothetical protein
MKKTKMQKALDHDPNLPLSKANTLNLPPCRATFGALFSESLGENLNCLNTRNRVWRLLMLEFILQEANPKPAFKRGERLS